MPAESASTGKWWLPRATGIIQVGGEWPEARDFFRMYGGNPFAQAALLQVLLGLYANASEGWKPAGEVENGIESSDAALAIAGTVRFVYEQLPEWRSQEPFALDPDFKSTVPDVYPGCEPRLLRIVEHILADHFPKVYPAEHNPDEHHIP